MGLIIILIILAIISVIIAKKTKHKTALDTITLVTGAVKTGKSTLAVHLALKSYRQAKIRYYIAKYLFHRDIEKPLLYSNIPLATKYVTVTKDILLRKERIAYKSVMLLDEAALVADSQLIRDGEVNKQLLLFFKLFGHSGQGSTLIIDTQAISDLHYAIKRCINSYIYIYKTIKVLPFFIVSKVLEQRYSDDGTVISAQTNDIEDNLKTMIIPKSVWKKFDCYCYSVLTDSKPVYKEEIDGTSREDLKTNDITSFRGYNINESKDIQKDN